MAHRCKAAMPVLSSATPPAPPGNTTRLGLYALGLLCLQAPMRTASKREQLPSLGTGARRVLAPQPGVFQRPPGRRRQPSREHMGPFFSVRMIGVLQRRARSESVFPRAQT